MIQPIILTSEFALQELPAALGTVHEKVVFERLMADWWNAPGIFKGYDKGFADLQAGYADCVSGSAFGPVAEMCWRQVGDRFRAVLVAEQDLSAILDSANMGGVSWKQSTEHNPCIRKEDLSVMLWGTECLEGGNPTNPSTWVEVRIPRILEYPVKPEPKAYDDKDGKSDFEAVFMQIKAYYDDRGRPIIYRRYGLRAQLESLERKRRRQNGRIDEHNLVEESGEVPTNG